MLYKRGDTWYADITTANGKRIRRTLGTTDKQAAEELHDKLKYQQWRIDRIGEKPKRTWDEACIRWLNEKGHKKSIEQDKQMIRRLTALRGMYLNDITRDLVIEIVQNFGKTNATKNRFIQLIRGILNRAMKEWEWIETVPYFSLYPEPQKRIRWLTPDEAKRLHPPVGNHARSGIRLSYEGRNVAPFAKNIVGFRFGCDGCCIGMVATDSIHGDGSRWRPVVGFARSRRFSVGYGIPAGD